MNWRNDWVYRIEQNPVHGFRVMARRRWYVFGEWKCISDTMTDMATFRTCAEARAMIATQQQALENARWTTCRCPVLRGAPGAAATEKLACAAGLTPPCCQRTAR